MNFKLSGKTDVYLEIAERFTEYIHKGIFKPGERLPSVRRVAVDMGVNPNTVARAYSTLEERGIIHTLPKKGVYVSETEEYADRDSSDSPIATIEKWKDYGISKEELLRLIEEVYKND